MKKNKQFVTKSKVQSLRKYVNRFISLCRCDSWCGWEHGLFLACMQPLWKWRLSAVSGRGVSFHNCSCYFNINHCVKSTLKRCLFSFRSRSFRCLSCKVAVDEPDTKIQLEVFLSCSSLSDCTLKVKVRKTLIWVFFNLYFLWQLKG